MRSGSKTLPVLRMTICVRCFAALCEEQARHRRCAHRVGDLRPEIRLIDWPRGKALLYHALGAGKSVRWVADQLGHADPAPTLPVYAQAMPEEEADLSFAKFGSPKTAPYGPTRSSDAPVVGGADHIRAVVPDQQPNQTVANALRTGGEVVGDRVMRKSIEMRAIAILTPDIWPLNRI